METIIAAVCVCMCVCVRVYVCVCVCWQRRFLCLPPAGRVNRHRPVLRITAFSQQHWSGLKVVSGPDPGCPHTAEQARDLHTIYERVQAMQVSVCVVWLLAPKDQVNDAKASFPTLSKGPCGFLLRCC